MKDLVKNSNLSQLSKEPDYLNPRTGKHRRGFRKKRFEFLREDREEYIVDVNEKINQVLELVFMACRSW